MVVVVGDKRGTGTRAPTSSVVRQPPPPSPPPPTISTPTGVPVRLLRLCSAEAEGSGPPEVEEWGGG